MHADRWNSLDSEITIKTLAFFFSTLQQLQLNGMYVLIRLNKSLNKKKTYTFFIS